MIVGLKSKYILRVALLFSFFSVNTFAEVILDGSLGSATTLTGPHFNITADLGQQQGSNLFHSFNSFNLNKGEIAAFSGPETVQNIIGRITGDKSFIDGQLYSNIPQANLYLINPKGFSFGPNATLDLQGSLHISTAHYIDLGESGIFYSQPVETSLLVSAPPSAFGFLDSQPAAIEIKGSELATRQGQILSMLGGHIRINQGHLRAISGRINLAAIQSAGQLKITPTGLSISKTAQLGQLFLEKNSSIDVGKVGAGDIYIRGGQFALNNSNIIANTSEDKDGGVIALNVNELRLDNADIDSRSFGTSHGGEIIIQVGGSMSLLNQSSIRTSSLSTQIQAGDAGDITLKAQQLSLENSVISTTTSGSGQGGDINIEVFEEINLLGSADFPTAIQASSEPRRSSDNDGDAGQISIQAKNLNLTGATSKIDNSTLGTGQGGSITLNIKDTLRLTDQALISSDSFGLDNAGSIYINTKNLHLFQGTISTAAVQAEGGNIIINALTRLNMTDSVISATVNGGQGNGGNLVISNPRFFQVTESQIIANASAGNGGIVLIITGSPIVSHESSITASSETGLDGEVKIDNIYKVNLATLPVEFLDASILIKKRCAAKAEDTQSSSFFIVGRGGLPNTPEDLQTYLPSLNKIQ